MKIDTINLTQQFSSSIFTDFRYQSIKNTWLLSIFIDTDFYRLTTPGGGESVNSVLFSLASNFHASTVEDTDHKDFWQCGTFPWSQSLLVGFGNGALLAYNFVERDRLLQTKLNQKEMSVTFCNLRGRFYCWSSFAGNVFLVTGRFDCFVRFHGAVNSRISTTRAENVTQYLLITCLSGRL